MKLWYIGKSKCIFVFISLCFISPSINKTQVYVACFSDKSQDYVACFSDKSQDYVACFSDKSQDYVAFSQIKVKTMLFVY